MSWAIVAGVGSSIVGGAIAGKGAKDAAEANAAASGPWAPTRPYIESILTGGKDWFEQAKEAGFIDPTGGVNQNYYDYLQQLSALSPAIQGNVLGLLEQSMGGLTQAGQSLGGSQDIYNRLMAGEFAINPEQVIGQAEKYINNDLLEGAITAATRSTARDLFENQLPALDANAIGAGSLGSSRAGVQAAIAERAANDRIADTSATMRSQAYENALTRAMAGETQNVGQITTGAAGGLNVAGQLTSLAGQGATLAGNLPSIVTGSLSPILEAAKTQQAIDSTLAQSKIGERDFLLDLLTKYSGLIGPFTGFSNPGAGGTGMNAMNYGNLLMQLGPSAASMFMQRQNTPQTYSAGTGPYANQFGNNPYQIIN